MVAVVLPMTTSGVPEMVVRYAKAVGCGEEPVLELEAEEPLLSVTGTVVEPPMMSSVLLPEVVTT